MRERCDGGDLRLSVRKIFFNKGEIFFKVAKLGLKVKKKSNKNTLK